MTVSIEEQKLRGVGSAIAYHTQRWGPVQGAFGASEMAQLTNMALASEKWSRQTS